MTKILPSSPKLSDATSNGSSIAAIAVEKLSVRLRNQTILKDCSFELPQGRIAALVGPNGCGKTTLLRAIAGGVPSVAGQITMLGRSAGRNRPEVSYVAQGQPLHKYLRVDEMLQLAGRMNPGRWNMTLALKRIDELEISRRAKIGNLSGGHRAQVALIIALCRDPRVILLDEPLASLDPLARRSFMGFLMGCAAESEFTAIVSTHVTSDLEDRCDWLVLMRHGQVEISGDVDSLLECHWWLRGVPRTLLMNIPGLRVVHLQGCGSSVDALVQVDSHCPQGLLKPYCCGPSFDQVVMAYLEADGPNNLTDPNSEAERCNRS